MVAPRARLVVAPMPLPDRLTVAGLWLALLVMVSVPARLPVAVGADFTLTVHEPFAAMDEPQVLVWVKSPLVAMDETGAAEPVGLETVTVCAALVVAEPKLSTPGLTVTARRRDRAGTPGPATDRSTACRRCRSCRPRPSP